MDFSKFSASNFDAKEWVNGALRTHKDSNTPLDVRELKRNVLGKIVTKHWST